MKQEIFKRLAAVLALAVWAFGIYIANSADPSVPWLVLPVMGLIIGAVCFIIPLAVLAFFLWLVCIILGVDFDE